jgi:hypothetical protein
VYPKKPKYCPITDIGIDPEDGIFTREKQDGMISLLCTHPSAQSHVRNINGNR